ncbi:polyketide synthase [Nemania sp. FL0916]|nr:polyketide synthase [Nemania sp. FL0916]
MEPIAVIGAGCRFPGGADTPSKLWEVIKAPEDLTGPPPADRFDSDAFYHADGTHHGTTNAAKSYYLSGDVGHFDAGFFSIQAAEAESMDPQQRLLMEVVYDGLSAAGQRMEALRGSDTAVYVGLMCDDYNAILRRDWETLPRYTATGLCRAIHANRISYFFGWHGASVAVDTACSSGMVAVDQAVAALRSGKSSMAVAAGTNLLLTPDAHISESKLGMLSPNGHCRMWDAAADGYARGEGVACVVLKTLSQALADNDPIECVIRETGVNQDGRTPGLTMPSGTAQTALIRACYERAGLDPLNRPEDRPQFFHAHGTGTQAGDPQEASAISNALFTKELSDDATIQRLLVGSIKTVIGHTEGTAGIASIIGTMLSLKNRVIPPNLHFRDLNPSVAPYYKNLLIPTEPTEWVVGPGEVRRASVNSFGFGGTNAHCILEEYIPASPQQSSSSSSSLQYTPLVFSASSTSALKEMFSSHIEYLKSHPEASLSDVAYTLQHRRSVLPYRKVITAATTLDAISALEQVLKSSESDNDLTTRFAPKTSKPRLLGVFTGQGAQWPRMGAMLLESSPFAQARIAELDAALQSLPNAADRPSWSLRDQLLASKDTSRIAEAALSQPLCTAVQVVLVDILRTAGISFAAVVGHSSGEIGAAYAAGLVSAKDAIRVAYFRGVYARLASNGHHRGAMMAVGASFDEAKAFCASEQFAGRVLQVAAVNSESSVTLSGDEEAVDEAEKLLKSQGKFARKLKVDTAYHSAHMDPCAKPYLTALEECGVLAEQVNPKDTETVWYSSVVEGEIMTASRLTNQYWVDNMCNPVLFAGALSQAIQAAGPFDLAIEVGPHPALKGPALATVNALRPDSNLPYTGLLSRGQDDVAQLSAALGFLWTQLGADSVRFSAVESLLKSNITESDASYEPLKVLADMPAYPFDHQRSYWTTSRLANTFKHRSAPNPLLGSACSEAATSGEFQWRNLLRPREIPWLKGHMLQGQVVFPATGYICMAIEAMRLIALEMKGSAADADVSLFELTDVELPRAIAFGDNEDDTGVEVIFSVSSVSVSEDNITADWACYTAAEGPSKTWLNAKGRASCQLSPARPDTLVSLKAADGKAAHYNTVPVTPKHFYSNLSRVGYGYSPPFSGLTEIEHSSGYSTGKLVDQSESTWENGLVLHPGLLDTALQTLFAAWFYPGDTRLWALHVPVSFSAVTINPYYLTSGKEHTISYETFVRSEGSNRVVGDIYLLQQDETEGSAPNAVVQFEGAALVPFSPASPSNDLPMFSRFKYGLAAPDGILAANGETMSDYDVQMFLDVDRISYWYARNAAAAIPADERHELLPHFQHYLTWCDRMVDMVTRDQHPKVKAECNADTRQVVDELLARYTSVRDDFRFVQAVGDNLVPVIRDGENMLEHMNKDGLLRAFYAEDAICSGPTGRWLSGLMAQISHRFPGLNILEVGAGTGATTSLVLRAMEGAYSSYTFTDISSGFFLPAEERFADQGGRMIFKTLDMEKPLSPQGYVEGTYDVLIAVNVLHVSVDMEVTMSNLRRLLKPGGFVVVGELTSTDLLFTGMTVGTLPGWWIGAETGRPWGPLLSLPQWDSLLRKTGYGGVDTVTPDIDVSLPFSVFVAQATDDRVALLRDPLGVKVHPRGIRTDSVAIIGGTTWPVYKLGREVFDLLGQRFIKKNLFETVEDFSGSDMTTLRDDVNNQTSSTLSPATVLCLADLDTPFLQNMTASKFAALKTLLTSAGTLVWVTCGSRADKPWSYMMAGLLNTIKTELPGLHVQIFDLDNAAGGIQSGTANKLAETLLRQLALRSWASTDANGAVIYTGGAEEPDKPLLWTSELQVFVEGERQVIPRLKPDSDMNARYNSRRRDVFAEASPSNEALQLVGTGRGSDRKLELHKVSPLRDTLLSSVKSKLAESNSTKTIAVTHSLLQSVAVGGAGLLRLVLGTAAGTGESVIALTHSSDNSVIVPSKWCVTLTGAPKKPTTLLVAAAAQLVAQHILSFVPAGSTLLVNEADPAVLLAIQAQAGAKKVDVVFTSSELSHQKGSAAVFLRPGLPRHVYQTVVPRSTAVYVHFSRSSASDIVNTAISSCLPPSCIKLSEDVVLGHEVKPLYNFNAVNGAAVASETSEAIARVFTLAATAALAAGAGQGKSKASVESIALADAPQHKATGQPLAVVDWTASASVTAKVQPIDAGIEFRADRTYLFVGMAGELGQSLARWMITHGARHVVLTSRNPKVSAVFINDMARQHGATVEAVSLDVTSRESIKSIQAYVAENLPPIGGVVNGALILDDSLFTNMTLEQFTRVGAPKVLGTQLLDEAFAEDKNLDFFVVCSSISSVIGWRGQSNYAAANDYMTSLVSQRLKRGVAGSAINIPAVLGVGYAANSDFDFEGFEALGYFNISERDLHLLFAEAIFTGHPARGPAPFANPSDTQVAMGVNYVAHDFHVEPAHRRDVKLSHFTRYSETGSSAAGGAGGAAANSVRVKVQLENVGAEDADARYTIVRDGFLAHLKRLLRISDDERALSDASTLVDQGVDSLVAVDIRSWFRKELDVDVPTLKVLGGGAIADLLRDALEKMKAAAAVAVAQEPQVAVVPVPVPGAFEEPAKPAYLAGVDVDQLPKIDSPTYDQSSPNSSPSPLFTPADDSGTQSDAESLTPSAGSTAKLS